MTSIKFGNFNQIDKVNYLMIAEAPLWGQVKRYIYNPDINNSQFFYRSDLEEILKRKLFDKKDFINVCNEIGLLVVDISPFALNPKDTMISYRKNKDGSKQLTKSQYRHLVSLTIPKFFEEKIRRVKLKKSADIKTFFRYSRVKDTFQDLISNVLIDNEIIKTQNEIGDISQNGGGVDKIKLKQIINFNLNKR